MLETNGPIESEETLISPHTFGKGYHGDIARDGGVEVEREDELSSSAANRNGHNVGLEALELGRREKEKDTFKHLSKLHHSYGIKTSIYADGAFPSKNYLST